MRSDWRDARHGSAPARCVACIALFVCTGMIYACIKFLQEWASPLTLVNFFAAGTAPRASRSPRRSRRGSRPTLARCYAVAAIALDALGLRESRAASLARNARLRPKSTLQTAIGIKHPRIVQKAQGFMGGSFNTREFFHGASTRQAARDQVGLPAAGAFAVPVLCCSRGSASAGTVARIALAFVVQYAGLLAERWYFFAQANHPQNLYYQAIS